MQVLARGGASAAAAAAAENAAREAEERQAAASGPVQLDELGRDMNVMARREAEERAQGRDARLQQSLPLLVGLAWSLCQTPLSSSPFLLWCTSCRGRYLGHCEPQQECSPAAVSPPSGMVGIFP